MASSVLVSAVSQWLAALGMCSISMVGADQLHWLCCCWQRGLREHVHSHEGRNSGAVIVRVGRARDPQQELVNNVFPLCKSTFFVQIKMHLK